MPYSDKDYKVSNVNYLNKDFSAFKNTLIEYAKTYFPNTYRDFNETSPGMMLIEMSAYVGDVLSFYIDQQYKEMMLPLAEERRNVINMANMLGYKVPPINPSYVDLTFTQTITANSTDVNNVIPNFSEAFAINKGAVISSVSDSAIKFETLDVVDFTVSGAFDSSPEQNTFDSNGIVQDYKLTRKVRAISAETKTKKFTVGSPEKFLKITLPETNVIDIVKVTDGNDNTWYETDYLAQDQVPIETHYDSSDDVRTSAYGFFNETEIVSTVPVPYSLQYRKSSKRFITEINDDNTTSIVFGNGVLRGGTLDESSFIQLDQVGITIPGEESQITDFVDPLNFNNNTNTLGEAPSHTTLTVEYRVGGGILSNVSSTDLTTIDSKTIIVGTDNNSLTVTNEQPARGGSNGLSVEEIRNGAKAYFATQNRCVTQEDYEARVLSMPAKFGNIAKVFVERVNVTELSTEYDNLVQQIKDSIGDLNSDTLVDVLDVTVLNNAINTAIAGNPTALQTLQDGGIIGNIIQLITDVILGQYDNIPQPVAGTLDVHILSYDNNKNLVTLPSNGNTIHPIKTNLKNYLSQYRMITDEIQIKDGKIINFGVVFDVVAHKSANKSDVKLRCINAIINYFNVDRMQFHQPLYTSNLEYEMMGLDGVRSVNFVRLTQGDGINDNSDIFTNPLYSFNNSNPSGGLNEGIYGWQYDFTEFYGDSSISSDGIILPSVTPSVFELKNPNENVKGVVR